MCFCVSIYPYKVSFCHFPDNFCFGFLKYFSKSNELTISPGWLAFTVNIWLVESQYLQNHLASRENLNKKCGAHNF